MMTLMVVISCDSALTLLVCEDDQLIEVHKVILPASSPVVLMMLTFMMVVVMKR